MPTIAKTLVAIGFIGSIALGTSTSSFAQGVYIEGPGVAFGFGRSYREGEYRDRDYDLRTDGRYRRDGERYERMEGRRDGERYEGRYRRDRD